MKQMLYKNSSFTIYFGNARTKFIPDEVAQQSVRQNILSNEPFNELKHMMQLEHVTFLHQVHGNHGVVVSSSDQIKHENLFFSDGDFLITALPHIGLGIATADCLPIVIYDEANKVIANVHAGWRGSAQEIVVRAVEAMCNNFGSKLDQLQFFFGPSGKACCYEIKEDILPHFEKFPFKDEVIQQRDTRLMLDVAALNRLQLEVLGIKKNACNVAYNACTLCMPSFCSFRRSKNAERQMTVVALIY